MYRSSLSIGRLGPPSRVVYLQELHYVNLASKLDADKKGHLVRWPSDNYPDGDDDDDNYLIHKAAACAA